jgi:hypothetical protein
MQLVGQFKLGGYEQSHGDNGREPQPQKRVLHHAAQSRWRPRLQRASWRRPPGPPIVSAHSLMSPSPQEVTCCVASLCWG